MELRRIQRQSETTETFVKASGTAPGPIGRADPVGPRIRAEPGRPEGHVPRSATAEWSEPERRARRKERFRPNPQARLLDPCREVLRFHHFALRMEQTYVQWIRPITSSGDCFTGLVFD